MADLVHTRMTETTNGQEPGTLVRLEKILAMKTTPDSMRALNALSSVDLSMLLGCARQELLGRILELNHLAHYHNRLNAIELASLVEELRNSASPEPNGSPEKQSRTQGS